ncbi:hypothetical protein [Deefgea sp. CFH1-16]|uniref:hypothetical protein n=1 Tax=Deefgea sp. CFH1-16 TaxID=2675457 RepID=UPI0019402A06|nr:hypothetical protein [Deefgea sp. CFH1-16]
MAMKESRTASQIFKKGFMEPYLRSHDKPFIKLLNWYTGFGKTYTAAVFAIDLYVNCDVIPVFIAPLQSLITGFSNDVQAHNNNREYADDIESAILKRGAAVPVYRLYSVDYHLNDRTFFEAALALVNWLETKPEITSQMERGEKQTATNKGVIARLTELRSKCKICSTSQFLSMPPSDDTYEDTKAAYILRQQAEHVQLRTA